ncbi:FAD-dependent oxidoreductase [soil metagenome]
MTETDLIIVGGGAAGLTTAVVAALRGLSVTVLEKTSTVGGTMSVSGGGVYVPNNRHMSEVGVTDSREEALAYLRACAGDAADDSHLIALVDEGPHMVEYLEDHAGLSFRPWPSVGGTIDYRPWLPGSKHGGRPLTSPRFDTRTLGDEASRLRINPKARWTQDPLDYYAKRVHLLPPSEDFTPRFAVGESDAVEYSSGTALAGQLFRACLAAGVQIETDRSVRRLVVEDGCIVGVVVEEDGAAVERRSRLGVVMTTGGFSHNEELKRLWIERPLEFSNEIEENQGDGHLMGAAVGAQLAGLGDAWWMPQVQLGVDNGVVNAGGSREDRSLPHTMMVNPRGRRFMNESMNYYDAGETFGLRVGGPPRNYPAWLLFDQQGVDRYALLAWKLPGGVVPEWLEKADTIHELAERLSIDPAVLAESVTRFNGFARSGVDEDFHRGEDDWDRAWGDPAQTPNPSLGTLEKAPFYAMPVHPGALATRGGLRVDDRGRVLAALGGSPIPGLFAAGNCSNGAPNGTYPGPGATLGAAMTFGYIIGSALASEAV